MRTLTNNYADCRLIRAEPENPNSPFVVAQKGADPEDPTYRQALFFLQRDGRWIEETANAARPQEARYQIVFDTLPEVMALLSQLTGAPRFERIEVSTADLQAYIARMKSTTTEAILTTFLAQYRASKGPA